jgi:hypothetical protein
MRTKRTTSASVLALTPLGEQVIPAGDGRAVAVLRRAAFSDVTATR